VHEDPLPRLRTSEIRLPPNSPFVFWNHLCFLLVECATKQNIAGMATMVPTSTNDPSRSGYYHARRLIDKVKHANI